MWKDKLKEIVQEKKYMKKKSISVKQATKPKHQRTN